jgi:hypothetical protein
MADCVFAKQSDVDAVRKWRRQFRDIQDQDIGDALEFADIACKRWRTYSSLQRRISGIDALRRLIANDPSAEAAMLAVIRLRIGNRLHRAGFCLFRRTWCNHLILDLLAANPAVAAEFSGAGSSILYFITAVAESIGAPIIWGEATQASAPFYKSVFKMDGIDDLFRINHQAWRNFRERYDAKWQQSGLPMD